MRVATRSQRRLDCTPVSQVQLNMQCRHEMIPFLRSLQHIYDRPKLRDQILQLVAEDVNAHSSPELGREGMTYWQILVLASARLELNLDYDALQDMAENHRKLRHIMEVGDWQGDNEEPDFNWERIRDNVCLLAPETLKKINELVIAEGHRLFPQAAEAVRGDAFVAETNIHYPTESSLIRDGIRKALGVAVLLAGLVGASGWRQHEHLLKKVKKLARQCDRIANKKSPGYQGRLKAPYGRLLEEAERILDRAEELEDQARRGRGSEERAALVEKLAHYRRLTERVCDTARRRVLAGEQVPNEEKLFSIFEPETQLFKRGKAGEPVQFGHLVFVVEDAVGFVCEYRVLAKGEEERDIVVPEMRALQKRLRGKIKKASFDRGFHSPENQEQLAKIVEHVCLPMTGKNKSQRQQEEASEEFHAARQRHPGIESAIGALQSGNGLKRCRDHTHLGFERYVGLGVLGRNLHVLGKLLLAREDSECLAGSSKRQAIAA
jgi:IS5 family transposase